jgi:tRNA nucleotidyltransferase (CCA-adding enzyme)
MNFRNNSQEHFILNGKDRKEVVKHISMYLGHLQDVKLSITGKDIVPLGIKPGPVYTTVLNRTLSAKLDGIVKTRDEELEFVKGLIGNYG